MVFRPIIVFIALEAETFKCAFFPILMLFLFPPSHYFLGNLHSTNGRIIKGAFLGSRLKRGHCINTVLSMNHYSMKHNWAMLGNFSLFI